MFDWLLNLDIVGGPLITTFFVLSAVTLLYLLARPLTRRWILTVLSATGVGMLTAVGIWFFVEVVLNLFGRPLSLRTWLWLAAACVGVGLAVVSLWASNRRRKVVAAASIVLFLVTGILGVNAGFGLYRTLGSLLGVTTEKPITLPRLPSVPHHSPSSIPLWKSWVPPATLPAVGRTGTQIIPNTLSGFQARPAGIYLPPAALVPNAPALPLVIMLMGQPGAPDPSYIAATLNREAAKNKGLAPIVIVADQLGDPTIDPLCLDTPQYGKAETYLTRDVVNWARANLHIIQNPRYWTIAGYSNGGSCAISLGAKYPNLWSNIVDISGEEYPGADNAAATLKEIFAGSQPTYEAQKPVNLLAARRFPHGFAVFTIGSNDSAYIPGVKRVAAAAKAAGMKVTYWETPNGGHVLPALTDGLDRAFAVLEPHLGLAPPVSP